MLASDAAYKPAPIAMPKGAGGQPPAAGLQQAAPPAGLSGQSTWRPPQAIDPSAPIGNLLAQGDATADRRFNEKQTDRAGVSRSKGTASNAMLAGTQARADMQNQAAQAQLGADKTNAAQTLDYQYGSDMEGQKLAMIQQAMGQSDWSVQMAQQMAAAKIQAAQQSGKLQVLNAYV